jgi:hypothetical protein
MIRNPWFRLGLSALALGTEASSVIALRVLKIAAGGSAGRIDANSAKERSLGVPGLCQPERTPEQ